MSITIKSVVNNSAGADVVALPSQNVATGDLLVVLVGWGLVGATGAITDTIGNTYTYIGSRNGGTAGIGMWFTISSGTNAANIITADMRPIGTAIGAISAMAWQASGVSAYNADQVNNANFSGTSTTWTVGPTTVVPPANSLFIFSLSANNDEPSAPDPTGYNTTGVNGFTAGMKTNAHQEAFGGIFIPIISGYKISSAAETPSSTLPAAAIWMVVAASFSPSGGGGGGGTNFQFRMIENV